MERVTVGGFVSRSMAELSRSFLADHGIASEVTADDAGGAAPHFSHAVGGVYLIVAEQDADRARELLDQASSDVSAAEGMQRRAATWTHRVGVWALGAVLLALAVAIGLSLLTGS